LAKLHEELSRFFEEVAKDYGSISDYKETKPEHVSNFSFTKDPPYQLIGVKSPRLQQEYEKDSLMWKIWRQGIRFPCHLDKKSTIYKMIVVRYSTLRAQSEFFKLNNKSVLTGQIYGVISRHMWVLNATWMLAQLHVSRNFQICSLVNEDGLARISQDNLDELTGFAREIALAWKLGYRFAPRVGTDKFLLMIPPKSSTVEKSEYTEEKLVNKKLSELSLIDIAMDPVEVFICYRAAMNNLAIGEEKKESIKIDDGDLINRAKIYLQAMLPFKKYGTIRQLARAC
jgi:hypothetical protein